MNSTQSNKLNMFIAVKAVLDSYETVWESFPAFAEGVEEFGENITNIQSLAQTQMSRSGAAADKTHTLQVLGDAAYEIAAATRASALVSGNKELAARVDFSRSYFSRRRDPEILARCQNVHAVATQYADSLEDCGVNASKLNALKKKIDAFQAAQPKPRQARVTSSAATKQLVSLYDKTDELLNKRLDGLAVQFKESQPSFYNAYRTGRRIVNNAAGHSSKEIPPIVAAPVIATASLSLSKAA